MNGPSNVPTLARLLCIGTEGPEVKALQTRLNQAQLGPPMNPDGKFGRKTHAALVAYQRKNGLKPDGVVGPGTARALNWNYNKSGEKPYIIRYDAPPLPAMTPPLAAIVGAIRLGMEPFKAKIAEFIRNGFNETPYFVNQKDTSVQFRQIRLRQEELEFHYGRLMSSLDAMTNSPAGDLGSVTVELKNAFSKFISEMHSGCRAMEFYGANMAPCHKALDRLPHQQIGAAVERVLKTEQTAVVAIAQIQLALENTIRMMALR